MKKYWFLVTGMVILMLLLTACAESGANRSNQSGAEGGFGDPAAALEATNEGAEESIPNTGGDDSDQLITTPTPDLDENDTQANNDTNSDEDQDKDDNDEGKGEDKDKDKDKDEDKGKDDDQNDDNAQDTSESSPGDFAQEEGLLPLSTLNGATVLNRGGQPIGTIDGVVMDENSGQLAFLIFDGLDDKKELELEGQSVAIPMSAFGTEEAIRSEKKEERERDNDRAVLVFDRDESVLKEAPAFDGDDELTGEMDEVQAYWADEGGAIPVTGENVSIRRMSSDDFEKIDVYNREGEQIGVIRDIVVDPSSGSTRYFLLELNDDSAEDGYLLVSPEHFNREGLDENERGFFLEADEVTLNEAPRIDQREDLYQFGK